MENCTLQKGRLHPPNRQNKLNRLKMMTGPSKEMYKFKRLKMKRTSHLPNRRLRPPKRRSHNLKKKIAPPKRRKSKKPNVGSAPVLAKKASEDQKPNVAGLRARSCEKSKRRLKA
ncbi:uncharacterized protein G2W53_039661 [Senna tora]|uniref:Uncharacterized protein n=1 Tax=Senna tora TaxID=362788 RepID=A0A834W315_9FABA|nr:uncharacterized protein G2W53_039661 [Senna tora]